MACKLFGGCNGKLFLNYYLLEFCLCLTLATLVRGGADPVVPAKHYTIDLDQSPQERWLPLVKDFKSSAPLIVDYFQQQVIKNETTVQTSILVTIWTRRFSYYINLYGMPCTCITANCNPNSHANSGSLFSLMICLPTLIALPLNFC